MKCFRAMSSWMVLKQQLMVAVGYVSFRAMSSWMVLKHSDVVTNIEAAF